MSDFEIVLSMTARNRANRARRKLKRNGLLLKKSGIRRVDSPGYNKFAIIDTITGALPYRDSSRWAFCLTIDDVEAIVARQ